MGETLCEGMKEVLEMGENNRTRGKKAPGVNPQGYAQDGQFTPNPKSELEDRAKKSNTKI